MKGLLLVIDSLGTTIEHLQRELAAAHARIKELEADGVALEHQTD